MSKSLTWLVDTPRLITELVEGNPSGGILKQPVNIFRGLLISLAQRASEIDDPELNILMLRLNLYDVPHASLLDKIEEQKALVDENNP
jgi:hypothetical protein